MTSEFVKYYEKVQEDALEMVNEIYDDLEQEMRENYHYTFETWSRFNESFLNEYNNYLEIDLRDAVEIIEQSQRQIHDSELWINAGDCKDQVKAMAYWIYRNDLIMEFKIRLKARLETNLIIYACEIEKYEKMIDSLQEIIDVKESEKSELELDIITEEDKAKKNIMEKKIENLETEIENLEAQILIVEKDMENPIHLHDNAENMIGEIQI